MAYEDFPLPSRPPRPVVPFSRPKSTGPTVTVACKLPHGLVLRLFRKATHREADRSGKYEEVDIWVPVEGQQFIVRGTQTASAGQIYTRPNTAISELLPGGYAITQGCPKIIWDQWYEANKYTPLCEKHIIFALPSLQDVTKEAIKLRMVRSGLEPVDQSNPGSRMPGGQTRAERMVRLDILQEGGADTSPR